MVLGTVIGIIIGGLVFCIGYKYTDLRYFLYYAIAGAITGLLWVYTLPYSLGITIEGSAAYLLGICIASVIFAEIPVINILYGLAYGGYIGYGIENYIKTVGWCWSWSWVIPLLLVISLLLLAVLYKRWIRKEHRISYSGGSADYRNESPSYGNVQKKVNPIFQGSKIDRGKARTWTKERVIEEIKDLRREIDDFNESIRDNQERIDEEEKKVGWWNSNYIEQLSDQIINMYKEIGKAEADILFLKSLL
nr:hypothetical membrane protein [uncultured archaeon]